MNCSRSYRKNHLKILPEIPSEVSLGISSKVSLENPSRSSSWNSYKSISMNSCGKSPENFFISLFWNSFRSFFFRLFTRSRLGITLRVLSFLEDFSGITFFISSLFFILPSLIYKYNFMLFPILIIIYVNINMYGHLYVLETTPPIYDKFSMFFLCSLCEFSLFLCSHA